MNAPEVRLGVVGLGTMGSSHAKNTLKGNIPGLSLVAVSDANPDASCHWPDQLWFSDPIAMFASGKIDAVLIATPHFSHTELGIQALSAGLHVLVEKPISVHKADCEKLLASPRRKDQVFAAMFNLRARPVYQKLRNLLLSGELGEITRVHWSITDWFRPQAYYDSGGWRGTWKGEGGGVLINQCPHQLDLWQWLFGMPDRIYARCQFGRHHDVEVEDDVTAIFEYSDGKTGVFVASTGDLPGTNTLEIDGEMGRVIVRPGEITFLKNEVSSKEINRTSGLCFGNKRLPWSIQIPVGSADVPERTVILRNFTNSILFGEPLLSPADEGIHSVELANAMLLSTLLKRAVDLPMDSACFEGELGKLIAGSKRGCR